MLLSPIQWGKQIPKLKILASALKQTPTLYKRGNISSDTEAMPSPILKT